MGKYDGTWYKDITLAESEDKYVNGGKVEARRRVAKRINPEEAWDTKTDKEVKKYLNNLKKQIRNEIKTRELRQKIEDLLTQLNNEDNLQVHTHAGCPKNLKVKFVLPCVIQDKYNDEKHLQAMIEFIENAPIIICECQPKVVNRWDVEYSGTLANDNWGAEKIEFTGINNGLAVNLG